MGHLVVNPNNEVTEKLRLYILNDHSRTIKEWTSLSRTHFVRLQCLPVSIFGLLTPKAGRVLEYKGTIGCTRVLVRTNEMSKLTNWVTAENEPNTTISRDARAQFPHECVQPESEKSNRWLFEMKSATIKLTQMRTAHTSPVWVCLRSSCRVHLVRSNAHVLKTHITVSALRGKLKSFSGSRTTQQLCVGWPERKFQNSK